MKKRHVMRALVAAATALALTACGSAGSSDASKSIDLIRFRSRYGEYHHDSGRRVGIPGF